MRRPQVSLIKEAYQKLEVTASSLRRIEKAPLELSAIVRERSELPAKDKVSG